jgi:aspartate/glutamate racemase
MNIKRAFQDWYAQEGVRMVVPKGQHWHEYYQLVAFLGGVSWASDERFQNRIKEKHKNYIMDPEDEIKILQAELELERRANLILQNAFHSLYKRFNSTQAELEEQGAINKSDV